MGQELNQTLTSKSPVGEISRPASTLVQDGVITDEEYGSALKKSEQTGYSVWRALREINFFRPRLCSTVRGTTPHAGPNSDDSGAAQRFPSLDHSASIPALVSNLFEDTTRCGATDIHFDPTSDGVKVRARIDGLLREIGTLPDEVARHVRSRIKVLAGMDVVEKRHPQNGHIYLQTEDGHRDFRVATILTGLGERMVVRVHLAVEHEQSLDALGLEPDQAATVRRLISRPQGLILVAGPIGSGKTTTLYACLRAMAVPERCLITIEDPIEYHLDGVNQIEVRPNLGLNFARGLRAVLRQDPNVIMVGEIRDRDTARTATRAAATGTLVLSSIHAADSSGVLRSLTNYHVPPHRIGESIAGIIVQRLVRTLCAACKRPVSAGSTTTCALANQGPGEEPGPVTLFEPTGCHHCFGTGFRGRTGVFEVIEFSEPARDRGGMGPGKARWSHALLAGRSCDLLGVASRKVVRGITTIDEVRRVFPPRHDVPGSPLVG